MFVTKKRYETELAQARKEHEETRRELMASQAGFRQERDEAMTLYEETSRKLKMTEADFRLEVRKRTVLETALADIQVVMGILAHQIMDKVKDRAALASESCLALNRGEEPPVRD